jgi:hypothetical protein
VVNVQGLYSSTGTAAKFYVGGGGVMNVSGSAIYTGNGIQIGTTQSSLPGNGTLNITSGSMSYSSTGSQFNLGYGTNGIINLTGGSLNVNSKILIGGNANTGVGTLNISGSGVFIESNSSSSSFVLGGVSGGSGSVNLGKGGLLQSIAAISGSSGTSIFNFNGGTLQALGNSTALTLATVVFRLLSPRTY